MNVHVYSGSKDNSTQLNFPFMPEVGQVIDFGDKMMEVKKVGFYKFGEDCEPAVYCEEVKNFKEGWFL